MALDIHQFPCLSDNYGYLIRDGDTGVVASIDTPDAEAILAELHRLGWRLDLILNTHWHPDHAGGNQRLKDETDCTIIGPEEARRIGPVDQLVKGGQEVRLGATRLRVLDAPGHTLGHIVYVDDEGGNAFVGDVIFAMGCGRLFEGTAPQMWGSLSSLAALPDETRIWCAHEYTLSNARFALSVDDSPALRDRAAEVERLRAEGRPTVPTTIGLEKATNPFLRAPLLRPGLEPAEAFAQLRAEKDAFRG
ncbi:hydroxyacylglutathione hydrolase [Brevundimonas sp. 2R-24]|uniref:Hydroxyacylglutathione hydrolase n=1 Tax=Peiella sedimenti TaxID=3061083 RepID=A0ABT8SLX1_9CAUL|nr:hydroxyacylglutathione hydrolase [Caulobacteraceae bacterium XZ-24]